MILCLLTIVLAILDQNIVSSAVVPIVRDLDPVHGIDHVAWLVAAFALGATAMLPLYGRLCDVLGAKQVYLAAIATFLTGSVLCGAAQSMTQLIAFRAIQGIGAGGLMSVTMVVMAHLREPGDKSGPGGLAGLIAGIGMAVGPLVGGLFADHGNWRWIFYINVPLGLVIIAGAVWALRFPRHTARASIDFLGASLAAGFTCALLLVCEWGGTRYAWDSPVIVVLVTAAVAGLGLFLWRQATAAQPILPLSLFRIPTVRTGYVIQGLVGVAMMGAMIYLMIYLQVARGVSSTSAGAYLAFMAIGMTFSGLLDGRLGWSTRTGMATGTGCFAIALGALACTTVDTSLWLVRGELVLLGIGLGQLLGKLIVVVQQAAPPHQLGVATTGIRFFQNLGGTIGAAAFGSLLSRVFEARTGGLLVSGIAHLAPAARPAAVASFVASVDVVFAVAAAVMTVAFLFAVRLREAPQDTTPAEAPRRPGADQPPATAPRSGTVPAEEQTLPVG